MEILQKEKVRLSKEDIKAIKETALNVFGKDVKLWIFGSRADLTKKGGDIDIYIEVPTLENWLNKKLDFLVKLQDKIGEQKIDVIIKPYECNEDLCIEAKNTGVRIIWRI